MTLWAGLLAVATAAPVLTEQQSPLERCLEEAMGEVDVDLPPAADLSPGAQLHRVAVVVGVPCHRRPEVPSLAYSARDAAQMGQQLHADGFEVVQLSGLVDRGEFLDTLDQVEAALAPGAEIVVYFSGHGVLAADKGQVRRFLVFSDTDITNVTRTGLRSLVLDDRISRMPADTRVLVQDTCFAANQGGKSLGMRGTSGRAKGLAAPEPQLSLQQGDVRLYAAQYFEQAIESPEHRGSLYTHHLLAALREPTADLDGDGCVDLREGHAWAREQTIDERAGHQNPQGLFVEAEAPTLGCRPGTAQRGVLLVPEGDQWTVEVRDRSGTIVRRDWGALDPATYRVQVGRLEEQDLGSVTHRKVLDARVRVEAGAWLDLEDEIEDRANPIHELTLDFAARTPRSDLPTFGGGLTYLRLTPSTQVGRPTFGARAAYTSEKVPSPFEGSAYSAAQHARSLEALGLVGHTWTRRSGQSKLGVGPLLGAGVAVVTKCSEPPCNGGITEVTSMAYGGVRARWMAGDTLTIAIDVGVDGTLRRMQSDAGDTVFEPVFAPALRVGVGPRL